MVVGIGKPAAWLGKPAPAPWAVATAAHAAAASAAGGAAYSNKATATTAAAATAATSGLRHIGTLEFVAGACAWLALFISVHTVVGHLRHFRKPRQQRYVCHILLMVPIYSIESWLAMAWPHYAYLLTAFRDWYEAYTIYIFFTLMMHVLGGERRLGEWLEHV